MEPVETTYGKLDAGDIFIENGVTYEKENVRWAMLICEADGNPPARERKLLFYSDSTVQLIG